MRRAYSVGVMLGAIARGAGVRKIAREFPLESIIFGPGTRAKRPLFPAALRPRTLARLDCCKRGLHFGDPRRLQLRQVLRLVRIVGEVVELSG